MKINSINSSLSVNNNEKIQFSSNKSEMQSNNNNGKTALLLVGLAALGAVGIYIATRGKKNDLGNAITNNNNSNNVIKNIMRKLKDGTEVLSKTEERDKDGNLLKVTGYFKDGTTVRSERIYRQVKNEKTGKNENILATSILYDEKGNIKFKKSLSKSLKGFITEKFGNESYLRTKYRFVETDGKTTIKKTKETYKEKIDNGDWWVTETIFGKGKSKVRKEMYECIDRETSIVSDIEHFREDGRLKRKWGSLGQFTTVYDKKGQKTVLSYKQVAKDNRLVEDKNNLLVTKTINKKGKQHKNSAIYLRNDSGKLELKATQVYEDVYFPKTGRTVNARTRLIEFDDKHNIVKDVVKADGSVELSKYAYV